MKHLLSRVFSFILPILLVFILGGCLISGDSDALYGNGGYSVRANDALLTAISESTVIVRVPVESPPVVPEIVEPEAVQIFEDWTVFLQNRDVTRSLKDRNYRTYRWIEPHHTLRFTGGTPVGAVYIEWYSIPGEYQICWEGGSLICGSNGFLHEYIRLPEELTEFYFEFPDGERKGICEIKLFTPGAAPDGVQDWLPPCEEADILFFPTHSDDDVLFFGPMIAYYAIERELDVQMAFMVDHKYQIERNHERLNGLWELDYPIVGKALDSNEKSLSSSLLFYERFDIPQWQVEQIRRFKPLVIVGHDLEGEYGNGGHKVNAHYLTQTPDLAADPEYDPATALMYGTWDTPKLYLHYYTENAWTFPIRTPVTKDPDGRTAFEIAQAATEFHVSQSIHAHTMVQNEKLRGWDCCSFGLYRTLVGTDTQPDIMENIDEALWRGN